MFQVLHARKIKTETGLLNVLKHNAREKIQPGEWINPDWKPDGLHDKGIPSSWAMAARRRMMADCDRKPQRNAAAAVEFTISAGEGFKDWRAYFKAARNFLLKKFGPCEIHTAIHTDETTPHMHIVFAPLLPGKKKKWRYSSSDFLGKRDDLRRLHTEFFEEVGKRFGLERGVEGSRAAHTDAKGFNRLRKQVEKKAAENERKEAELFLREEKILGKEKEVAARESEVAERAAFFRSCNKNLAENFEGLKKKIASGSRAEISEAAEKVVADYALYVESSKLKLKELREIKGKNFSELRADIAAAQELGASNFEEAEKIRKQRRGSRSRSSGGFGWS